MATGKVDKKQMVGKKSKKESLWRKPIALDAFENEDPLESLYRGGETGNIPENKRGITKKTEPRAENKTSEKAAPAGRAKKSVIEPKAAVAEKTNVEQGNEPYAETLQKESTKTSGPKMTESELKNLLKIKSESFQFTDLREILRGRSFDIYAYLRHLCGESGVCKIRHLDLMKKLDISRPTLFKQGDWLTRLSLIEKRNVPGDHLGTTYRVHRLEEVLPVPDNLIEQLESHIEDLGKTLD
jgi:hypothetical protein